MTVERERELINKRIKYNKTSNILYGYVIREYYIKDHIKVL